METAVEDEDIECINKPLQSISSDEAAVASTVTSDSCKLTSDIQEKNCTHAIAPDDKVSPSSSSSLSCSYSSCSSHVSCEQDEDSFIVDTSSSDVLIMKQLNEMKLILQQLLHDKQCTLNDSMSVNRMTLPNMLPECLAESTLSDSDLKLIACMRHLYPLSGTCKIHFLVVFLSLYFSLLINRSSCT